MLSFMRDQGTGNPPNHSAAATDPRDAQSPDNTGPQEYLTVASNSKNLRRSTVVVFVLLGLGLACLWLMIRKSQPQSASGGQPSQDEARIEAAINELTGVHSEMTGRMDAIVKKFYEFSDVFQVKVNELVKNPFEVEGYMKEIKEQVVVGGDPQTQAELIRRQRAQQHANTMRLLSIMRSETTRSCMINDQILQQGDKIEDFTVTEIGSNYVELVWQHEDASHTNVSENQELKIVLKLSE